LAHFHQLRSPDTKEEHSLLDCEFDELKDICRSLSDDTSITIRHVLCSNQWLRDAKHAKFFRYGFYGHEAVTNTVKPLLSSEGQAAVLPALQNFWLKVQRRACGLLCSAAEHYSLFLQKFYFKKPHSGMQSALRLVTLAVMLGPIIKPLLLDWLQVVPPACWEKIIPQLMATVVTPDDAAGDIIETVLVQCGRAFPRALIFPVLTLYKTAGQSYKGNDLARVQRLFETIKSRSPATVSDTQLLISELNRISPFWEDIWIDKIAHWSPDAVQRLLRVRFGLTRMRYWFLFWYIGFLRFKKYLNGASKTTRWLLSSK
jgi:hypothetical protein